jgi:glyoxylase-like metal-dependent hydrolase (beta-lactamase superfamily II)
MLNFDTEFSPEYGKTEIISPLIRRITAQNPSPYTFKGTGTYIIGHGTVAIIDPGPKLNSHIQALKTALKGETVSHILITHNHKDHSPAAKELADYFKTKTYGFNIARQQYSGHGAEEGLDRDFIPDNIIVDGDQIINEGWSIDVIHTPGHLSNHLCFALRDEKALFTGDHIMGWSSTVILPPDGNMQDYLNSLKKLLLRDDEIYYPTHGKPIKNPTDYVENLLKHRLNREQDIINAIKSGSNHINQMIKTIYPELPLYLHDAASKTLLAHLIRLTEAKEITCNETPSLRSFYNEKS